MAIARWRHGRADAIVPLFMFIAVAIEVALKVVLPHPAPPDDRVRTVELVPFVHATFPNSFPSGHVLRTTFLAAIVRGVPGWLGVAAVILMAASRVYLGEHWLSDCIGGLVLGLVGAGAAYAAVGQRDDRPPIERPGASRRR